MPDRKRLSEHIYSAPITEEERANAEAAISNELATMPRAQALLYVEELRYFVKSFMDRVAVQPFSTLTAGMVRSMVEDMAPELQLRSKRPRLDAESTLPE